MALTQPSSNGSTRNPLELTEIGHYSIREIVYSTAERIVYRASSMHNSAEVLVTLLTSLRLPAGIPIRDSANILRMRSSDLAKFKHQNVLSIIDAGECAGAPFVVHTYVSGTRLSSVIQKQGGLALEQLVAAMVRISAGLDAAHSNNIYHGALRPESILIDGKGHAFLADLGIEYVLQPLMAVRVDGNDRQLGINLSYQAPEQLRGARLDRKSDLYSLAALSFEALTGFRILDGESVQEIKETIHEGQFKSATDLIPNLPQEINFLYQKALSSQPKNRYESGHEFVCALARHLGIEPLSLNFTEPRSVNSDPRIPKFGPRRPSASGEFGFKAFDEQPAPGRQAYKPGTSFAHAKEQLSSNVPFIPRNPLYFWGGCLLLLVSCVCGWYLFTISSSAPAEVAELAVSLPSDQPLTPVQIAGFEDLEAPRVLAAPENTPIEALQDREILGLLWENTASESTLLGALREAQDRRIMDLVNTSIKPLNNGSAAVRAQAARSVGALGDKRIVPYLMSLLQDGDPMVRGEAARAIGSLGDRKALSFLSTRYIIESAPEVRTALRSAIDAVSGYPVSEAEISGFAR